MSDLSLVEHEVESKTESVDEKEEYGETLKTSFRYLHEHDDIYTKFWKHSDEDYKIHPGNPHHDGRWNKGRLYGTTWGIIGHVG